MRGVLAALVTALCAPLPAVAAEPGTPPTPEAVTRLAGCWSGTGMVMGKRTLVSIFARPILDDAMFAIDARSVAADDPEDRYAAHLLFGGDATGRIVGFWADSFGGAYSASGSGSVVPDGFDIEYAYPDEVFVNRWRSAGPALVWQVVSRKPDGKERSFAEYRLGKGDCTTSTEAL